MSTQTKIFAAVAIAATLAVAAVAFAADSTESEADRRPFAARFAERLASLGVTDSQKAQIHAILRQHLPTLQPIIKQVVTERRALRDTIRAENVNETEIRAQAAKVASLEADLAVQRARVVHEIRGVLTPEQIKKFQEMQAVADERVDGFMHRIANRIAAD
jgi:protein CpxP